MIDKGCCAIFLTSSHSKKINVTGVNTLSRDYVSKMKFTTEVKSIDQLKGALAQVSQVKGVQNARRI